MITITGRNTQTQYAAFDSESRVEELFTLIAKHDYYGIGEDMTNRFGALLNFFEDTTSEAPPSRVFLSNNSQMVMFNVLSEILTQNTANMRMTHSRILRKRRDNKDSKDIGGNMRADVIYKDTAIICQFLAILSTTIYSGESLIITEEAV